MIRQEYRWLTDIYIAHRGLFDNNSDVPENSVPAFELAVKNNFGIETDVQMTKDGVLVVFHDDTLKRMTGKDGKLADFTFDELRKLRLLNTDCVIPTFDEFLQAANGVNLVVDLKLRRWNGSQFIAYDAATIATNKAVAKYRKRIPIMCWTIRSQQALDELSPYFDNIIFDSFVPARRDLDKLKTQE